MHNLVTSFGLFRKKIQLNDSYFCLQEWADSNGRLDKRAKRLVLHGDLNSLPTATPLKSPSPICHWLAHIHNPSTTPATREGRNPSSATSQELISLQRGSQTVPLYYIQSDPLDKNAISSLCPILHLWIPTPLDKELGYSLAQYGACDTF